MHADTGPVFLTYRERPGIDAIVEREQKAMPTYDFTAPDGIRHTVWRIAIPAVIEEVVSQFGGLPAAYVADGHHGTASAARVALELRASGGQSVDSDWFLCVLFPAKPAPDSAITIVR